MKIVINSCYGGFSLSYKAIKHYLELKGKQCFFYDSKSFNGPYRKTSMPKEDFLFGIYVTTEDIGDVVDKIPEPLLNWEISRTDKDLITTVETLGTEANTKFSRLRIIEIPDDVDWEISEYDGYESVEEKHRKWC